MHATAAAAVREFPYISPRAGLLRDINKQAHKIVSQMSKHVVAVSRFAFAAKLPDGKTRGTVRNWSRRRGNSRHWRALPSILYHYTSVLRQLEILRSDICPMSRSPRSVPFPNQGQSRAIILNRGYSFIAALSHRSPAFYSNLIAMKKSITNSTMLASD